MEILKGNPVFPGIIIGKIYVYADESEMDIPHYNISKEEVPKEITRFSRALDFVKQEINDLLGTSPDKNIQEISTVHLMILSDKSLTDKIENFISNNLENAEHAVNDIFQEYIDKYKKEDGHFKELVLDFVDLRDRLIRFLMQAETNGVCACPRTENEPIIVASKKLTPYMVLNSEKNKIVAYVVKEGGYTTHAMILARSMGIPVIFNIDISGFANCLDNVIVDTYDGKIIINPNAKILDEYAQKIKKIKNKHDFCRLKIDESAKNKQGENIRLKVNISIPGELDLLKDVKHDGIGLLRTEFLFLERNHPPTEDEQFNMYKRFLEANKDLDTTIRFLDIGSDKIPLFFDLPEQTNPDLEIKGARAIDIFPEVYLIQAKALLRAGKFGKLRILYPLVSDISDILNFKNLLERAKKELLKDGQEFAENYKEGIMIETPSAVVLAEEMLEYVDFANIGSNDLQQYTMAASRENKIVDSRYHIFHPAIMKFIKMVIDAGNKTGKEICLCGEISSFEQFYPILLSLGVKVFSVPISKLFYIKCEIMHLNLDKKIDFTEIFKAPSKYHLDKIISKYV